jgi:hypothetical protein
MLRGIPFTTAALLLLFTTATAIEARSEEKYYGSGTHTGLGEQLGYEPTRTAEQLKNLRLNSFRDDVMWYRYSPQGAETPLGKGLQRLHTLLEARIGTPLLILNGGNPAVKGSNPPQTDQAREAFGEFARSVAVSTKPYNPIYEIWNEWDLKWRRRAPDTPLLQTENPAFSPENYVKLAATAYKSIKSSSNAKVLVGAVGGDPDWTWTRRAIRAGLLDHADGISVHIYNHCERPHDRSAENAIKKTEAFRRVVQDTGGQRDIKVYVTEIGWPSFEGKCSVPELEAASNTAQYILWSAATPWVGGVWVYELKNSGENKSEREHGFGIYNYQNLPKERTCAVQDAIKLARDMIDPHFVGSPEGIRWIKSRSAAGTETWVIWTTELGVVAEAAISQGSFPLKARPLCSAETTHSPAEPIKVGNIPTVIQLTPVHGANLAIRTLVHQR